MVERLYLLQQLQHRNGIKNHAEDASDFTEKSCHIILNGGISPKLTRSFWWVPRHFQWTSCWFFGQALARWEPEDSVEWLQYTNELLGHWLLYAGYPFDRSIFFSSPDEEHTRDITTEEQYG